MSLTAWALDNPTRWRRVTRAPGVVLGLLLVGGCAATVAGARDVAGTARVAATASATPTVTTSAPASAPASPAPAPASPSAHSAGDGHAHEAPPAPRAPRDAARALELRFVGAWARPDLSTADWRAGVQPLASEQFARALGTVDPANTPAARVAGPAVEQEELGMPDAAVYVIPLSDRARVQVTVVLDEAGAWKVDGILPVSAS